MFVAIGSTCNLCDEKTPDRAAVMRFDADGKNGRVYSSGPGLYTNLLLCRALGIRRRFGQRIVEPVLPRGLGRITLERVIDGRNERWDLSPT
jgi:cellobiose phosphorylase